jgi:hypothetical protein
MAEREEKEQPVKADHSWDETTKKEAHMYHPFVM